MVGGVGLVVAGGVGTAVVVTGVVVADGCVVAGGRVVVAIGAGWVVAGATVVVADVVGPLRLPHPPAQRVATSTAVDRPNLQIDPLDST